MKISKNRRIQVVSAVLLVIIIFGEYKLISGIVSDSKEYEAEYEAEKKATYGWSYERACEHNDFAVAHKLLAELKDNAYSRKKWYNSYEVKRIKKKHWFKDNEEIIDQKSLEKKESLKEEMEESALKYLTAFEYIYNAEITYLMTSDAEDTMPRIGNLLREMKAQLIWFKGSSLSDEADEFYNKIKDSVNLNDTIPK